MGAERREKLARRERREEALKRSKSRLEERVGSDKYNEMSADGLQAPNDSGAYTAAEVKAEFRNASDKGRSVNDGGDDMVSYFQQQKDDGAKFNFKAQQYLTDKYGFDFSAKTKPPEEEETAPVDDEPTETADPVEEAKESTKPPATDDSTASGKANNKFNEIMKKKSKNKNPMSSMSMAASRFGAGTGVASDTGLGGKDFVDYWANAADTSDSDAYADKVVQDTQDWADKNQVIDTAYLRTQMGRSMQDSNDRYNLARFFNFGDMTNPNYKPPAWENSAPDEVEEPDWDELYNRGTSGLK